MDTFSALGIVLIMVLPVALPYVGLQSMEDGKKGISWQEALGQPVVGIVAISTLVAGTILWCSGGSAWTLFSAAICATLPSWSWLYGWRHYRRDWAKIEASIEQILARP